jgi:hypothetical protein
MGAASPGLQLRPADHSTGSMLTSDCSGCHTTANWNSTALPSGHMPNPAGLGCTTCHTKAPTDYTTATLAANSILHTGISGNCGQCHGAATALTWYNAFTPKYSGSLSPAHIPYLAGTDCGSCHKSATYAAGTFGPMNMTQATHAYVTTTCDTCHGTAKVSYYLGAASPGLQLRPSDHNSGTMLTGDCSGCHTTANWNSTTMPSNHMPNPAAQACSTCHTKSSTGDYTQATLASNAILHTGISSGCITCHGAPNAAAPVYANSFTPKAASGLSPVHIPTSSTACQSCHSATTFTTFSGTTMTSAKHTAMFAVIGGTCDGCHDASTLAFYGVTNLQHRPSGHHVGQDCSNCHGTNNWSDSQVRKAAAAPATTRTTVGVVVRTGVARRNAVDALSANGGVAAARAAGDLALAPGASRPNTAPTAAAMTATASASAAPGAGYSHAGVTGNCAGCHNGVLAAGKGPVHIASNNACENCHTTLAWLPARFDHRGVTAACISCHNGVTAPGKPTRHIQTNQDCSACHGTLSWASAQFSHVGVSAVCRSCHNGVTATGKQLGHVNTTLDCGSCHSTLNWTVTAAAPRLQPLLQRRNAAPGANPTSNPRGASSGPLP